MTIKVEALHVYPIKSCAPLELDPTRPIPVTRTGLLNDHEFMVVDHENNHVSQRERSELALVKPRITSPSRWDVGMDVTAPGMPPLDVVHKPSRSRPQDHTEVYVHGKAVNALMMDDEASLWFKKYLDDDVHLVSLDPKRPRMVNERYQIDEASNQVSFADGFPLLLASAASLEHVNDDVEVMGGTPVPMDRFRPSIVVGGEELVAFEEDYWRKVAIGNMIAHVVRPCARCVIPHIDQATGQPSTAKGLGKALISRRGIDLTDPDRDKGTFFAQNLNHVYKPELTLRVGDEVIVLDQSNERNIELRT